MPLRSSLPRHQQVLGPATCLHSPRFRRLPRGLRNPRGLRQFVVALAALAALPWPVTASAASAASVQLEDLTWPELRERIEAGATTALVPIGGTEQSGPQIALGKHNARVQVLATRIAERLGDAIVAPVIAYVPEGAIAPPTQHMRWPGTISIPEAAFEATLEGAARSLLAHGFCHVVFLGDHGGYQGGIASAAARVNHDLNRLKPPPAPGCGALAMPEYYRAAERDFTRALQAQGFTLAEIGSHAGLADTALTLATAPALVRTDPATLARGVDSLGSRGDPRRASAEIGRGGADHIVAATVDAIRAATGGSSRPLRVPAPAHKSAPGAPR